MSLLRPAHGVGWLEEEGVVYAAHLPAGPIVVLDGIGALIWHEACRGERDTIAQRVAEALDVTAVAIRDDVGAFVADIISRGLLE